MALVEMKSHQGVKWSRKLGASYLEYTTVRKEALSANHKLDLRLILRSFNDTASTAEATHSNE
jgi:hypothetical protein